MLVGNAISSNLRSLIFKIFRGSMPPDPPRRTKISVRRFAAIRNFCILLGTHSKFGLDPRLQLEISRIYCLKFKRRYDIFYLISLRRNHKDHVPRIREYYEEVIPRYTDLLLDLQFRHHFRMSRPTATMLLLGN